jgi:hypothetical protein
MARTYKSTSFRFSPELLGKIEELAEAKTRDSKLNKKLTNSDLVSILVQEEHGRLIGVSIEETGSKKI